MNVGRGGGHAFIDSGPTSRHPRAVAEVLGGGLSCDAHHPAAPHPEGRGAYDAMTAALSDAGLPPLSIDYVNLHGTGTKENDLSEAVALRRIFKESLPPVSSVKGCFGHSLAASGVIEAVVAALCIREGFMPANVGWRHRDEAIGFCPLEAPRSQPVGKVLSNSFGFGGQQRPCWCWGPPRPCRRPPPAPAWRTLQVRSYACLTGAGGTAATLEQFFKGASCKGTLAAERLTEGLPPRSVRRMKRLPRIALGLAARTLRRIEGVGPISDVYFGTAWGALSETHDFLDKLYATQEFFTSPIDFVGVGPQCPGRSDRHAGGRPGGPTSP